MVRDFWRFIVGGLPHGWAPVYVPILSYCLSVLKVNFYSRVKIKHKVPTKRNKNCVITGCSTRVNSSIKTGDEDATISVNMKAVDLSNYEKFILNQ